MRTRVSTFCDRVIEVGWLLALVVVPLFFNVYSNRVFEPDKLGLLRSIATMMAVAWLIKMGEEAFKGSDRRSLGSDESGVKPPLLRMPLVLPTLLLVAVYLLATVTSVVPRVSLWGSYQRLQGTYTTLSYIVVFALMLQSLRRPEQLRRLLTTIMLTSLPIALYGLMQHYKLDPLPWGGDVTARVAANMGNAIFIGAYLIMVVPVTLARIIRLQSTALGEVSPRAKVGFGLLFWALLAVEMVIWGKGGFAAGIAASLIVIVALTLASIYFRRPMARFVLMGCYGFILSVQLVTVFYTLSRGPWMGLAAGLLFFGLLYLLSRRLRTAAMATVGLSLAFGVFLVLINIPGTPFPAFRDLPYLGRLGQVFEIEGGTGKVRVLIWGGVAEMVTADPVRAAIGYGPESMWVAYNRFYPPDLAHYESRNASPDRSHNETFDTLVITGLLGFAVYALLWGSILYYGFRWLGLVRTRAQRGLFFAFAGVGSLLGLVIPLIIDRSLRFVGASLPVGFLLGISAYMALSAFRRPAEGEAEERPGASLSKESLLLLVALLSGLVAHFVETQFGIAIAATRTYFWAYAAMFVLLGKGLLSAEVVPVAGEAAVSSRSVAAGWQTRKSHKSRGKRKGQSQAPRRRTAPRRADAEVEPARVQLVVIAGVVGLMLATLAWDYTTNPGGKTSPLAVIWSSLATLAAIGQGDRISLGMAWLVTASFLVSLLVAVSELAGQASEEREVGWWASSFGIFVLVAGGIGGLFALSHAARLGPRTDLSNLLYEYYVLLGGVWVGLALCLHFGLPRPERIAGGPLVLGYPILILVALLFVQHRNISIIRADVLYKHGLRFDGARQWDQAIHFYQKAVDVTPWEDFFHFFCGRALMERAKVEKQPALRDAYYGRALESLEEARRLNPLNTDHTTNMARLYRAWGELGSEGNESMERFRHSAEYYALATQLSPHNAQIFNEWGDVCRLLRDPDQALVRYEQSLALDKEFAQTYFLMGDLHLAQQRWREAAQSYEGALLLDPKFVRGWTMLAYCCSQAGEWDRAAEANQRALELNPDDHVTLRNLASC